MGATCVLLKVGTAVSQIRGRLPLVVRLREPYICRGDRSSLESCAERHPEVGSPADKLRTPGNHELGTMSWVHVREAAVSCPRQEQLDHNPNNSPLVQPSCCASLYTIPCQGEKRT